jgi:hypothetical protein
MALAMACTRTVILALCIDPQQGAADEQSDAERIRRSRDSSIGNKDVGQAGERLHDNQLPRQRDGQLVRASIDGRWGPR